jgi:hypothetical protein
MFALLRTSSVIAVLGLTAVWPTSASAQWYDGWGWGWGGWNEPGWTSYYPGSYGYGYTASYGGGGYYGPGGCCDPCACNPCGCNPCGGGACGLGGCASGNCAGGNCANGNCAGGNCAYDAPANGAPVPDPNTNTDSPPLRNRTTPTPRSPAVDPNDNRTFETPMRNTDPMDEIERTVPRSRSTTPPRARPFESTDPGTGSSDPFDTTNPSRSGTDGTSSGRNFRDNSTAPAGGTARPSGSDPLRDPATDGGFEGSRKPELPTGTETVIPKRKPAETQDIQDGSDADTNGPRLDLKATTSPIVPKTRLAGHSRTVTSARTAKTPVLNDWSAAMAEPRTLR